MFPGSRTGKTVVSKRSTNPNQFPWVLPVYISIGLRKNSEFEMRITDGQQHRCTKGFEL